MRVHSIYLTTSNKITETVGGTDIVHNTGGGNPTDTVPDAPTINTIVSETNSTAVINFTAPANTGGNGVAILNYAYSIDGGVHFILMNQITSPYTITGLTAAQNYQCKIEAINYKGNSNSSNIVNFTVDTIPSQPSLTVSNVTVNSAQLNFSTTSDGGNAIIKWRYSFGMTWVDINSTNTTDTLVLTGLAQATYNVYIQAINSVGNSLSSTIVSFTCAGVPYTPLLTLTPGNANCTLNYSTGNNGGSPILSWQYSMNSGSTWTTIASTALYGNFTVSSLTNGTSYSFVVRAVNVVGASTSSSAVSVIPSTVPSTPNLSVSASNSSGTLSFDTSTSGGSDILSWRYSLNSGTNWTTINTTVLSSTYTISSLTNGTSYSVIIQATNANGNSASSSSVSFIPAAAPSAPSISVAAGNTSAVLSWTAGASNGSAITNYQYSFDNGTTYTSLNSTTSPFTITGLTNGTSYTIVLREQNSVGYSSNSASVTFTPNLLPVSYYQLSSNSTDTGSNPNSGVSGTTITYNTYYSKTGLSIYQTSSNFQMVLNPLLSITTGFSISFWLANVGSSLSINMLLKNSSNLILMALEFNSILNSTFNFSTTWGPTKSQTFASGTVSNSAWHHVVLVFTNTGITFYVDASSLTATTNGAPISTFSFSTTGNYLMFDRAASLTQNTAFRNFGFYNLVLTSTNVGTIYSAGLSST
jgi:hypothetical protein